MQEPQRNSVDGVQDKRVWPKLPGDVYSDLEIFANEERRTPSEMAAIFIENAIKERKRKRKNPKDGEV